MESEILAELQSKPLPDNVHAAFLKTCYNFADKMGLKLNLREHKQTHSYVGALRHPVMFFMLI